MTQLSLFRHKSIKNFSRFDARFEIFVVGITGNKLLSKSSFDCFILIFCDHHINFFCYFFIRNRGFDDRFESLENCLCFETILRNRSECLAFEIFNRLSCMIEVILELISLFRHTSIFLLVGVLNHSLSGFWSDMNLTSCLESINNRNLCIETSF